MQLNPVGSSNIEAIGYDEAAQVMHIKFRSGDTWRYDDVAPTTHEALIRAESVGRHFHQYIRDNHQATRLQPEHA